LVFSHYAFGSILRFSIEMVMLGVKRKGVFVIFRRLGGSKSQYIVKTNYSLWEEKQSLLEEQHSEGIYEEFVVEIQYKYKRW